MAATEALGHTVARARVFHLAFLAGVAALVPISLAIARFHGPIPPIDEAGVRLKVAILAVMSLIALLGASGWATGLAGRVARAGWDDSRRDIILGACMIRASFYGTTGVLGLAAALAGAGVALTLPFFVVGAVALLATIPTETGARALVQGLARR